MKDINKGSFQVHHRTLQRRLWRIIKQKDTAKDNEDDLLFPYPHNDEVIVEGWDKNDKDITGKVNDDKDKTGKDNDDEDLLFPYSHNDEEIVKGCDIHASLIHTLMK